MGTDNTTRIIVTADANQAAAAFSSLERSIGGLGGVISGVSALAPSLAGALSVGAFVAWSKSIIDAADEMNDLSQRIGIGVEQLAKYELAAKQSGTSMESVARGVKGLSAAMLEHGDDLRKAGITAKDADGAMRQLSDVFAAMPDGMEKTSLAVKLFGKAGMELIPMLNMGSKGFDESAQKSAKYAAALAALAPQADKFNDSLAEVAMSSRVAGISLMNTLMPSLVQIGSAMAVAAQEGGIWTTVMVGIGGLLSPLGVLFKGFMNTLDEANISLLRFFHAGEKDGSIAHLEEKIARRNREILSLIPSDAKTPEIKAPIINKNDLDKQIKALMSALGIGSAKSAKEAVDEFAVLMNKLNTKDVGLDASYWKDLETLHQGYLKGRVDVDEYAAAVAKLTNSQKFHTDAVKEQEEFYKELNKAQEEALAAAVKEAESLDDEVKKQRLANEEIGLTAEALAALKDARLADAIASKEQAFASAQAQGANIEELAAISHQIEALRELRGLKASGAAAQGVADAAKKSEDEWKKFNEQIEQSLTDALMRGFENGNGFAQGFVESLKNTLKTTVLKVAVQAVVGPVSNMMGGAMGMTGSGGSTGGGLISSGMSQGMSQMMGSGLGSMGMLGSGVSEAMLGSSFTGPSIALSGLEGASMAGVGSTLATAAPWIAAAAVIADAVGLFGKGGGPQTGQYGSIGASGYKSDYTMSGGDALGNQALAQSTLGQINALAAAAGKSLSDLNVNQGYRLDPQGSAEGFAYRRIYAGGKLISGRDSGSDNYSNAQLHTGHDDAAGVASYLGKLHTDELQALISAMGDPKLSAAADGLMSTFGELENALPAYLTAQAQQKALAQSMMSEAEKTAAATTQMTAAFGAAGIAVPSTTADFRALVEGLDLTTAAGQAQLVTLNSLAPAFLEAGKAMDAASAAAKAEADAAIARAMATAHKQRELDIELMKALGNTAGATAAEHADALAALDPSLRATQQAIWDAVAAQDAQAQATEMARAAQESQTAALTNAAQAADAARGKMDAMSASIKQAIAGLIGGMPGTAGASYTAAKADVSAMIERMRRGGAAPDEAVLSATLGALKPTTAGFSTRVDYQRDVMGTAGMLQSLDRLVMTKGATTADVVSELAKLRTENAQLRTEMANVAASSKKTAELLLRVTRDGNALVTTT